MITEDYPAHHQIQDLKHENTALAGLLEKGVGQAMGQELATLIQEATEYMRKPTVFAFGFGEVVVGLGMKGDTHMLTLLNHHEPLPIGKLSAEDQAKIKVDRDATVLTFANVKGLDVLLGAALKLREIMTGAPSPAEEAKRIAVEFIEKHRIWGGEATCSDRVYENAPKLVAQLAKVVGYFKDDDDDDEE